MADKNSSKNNFIMQAGILAAAGIISRIIGLLYRGPLQSVIGNLGLGYYQSAYNYYTIILLISSYSIPSAISKAIAQKLGEKEYRNAHRLFHGAMIYVLVVGGIASLFLFFGAGYSCPEQRSQYCAPLHRRSSSMVSWEFYEGISRHIRAWRRPPYRRSWSRSPMR